MLSTPKWKDISNLVINKPHDFANPITSKLCTIPKLIISKPQLLHHFLLFVVEKAWDIQDNTALWESKIQSRKETSETQLLSVIFTLMVKVNWKKAVTT